MEGAIQFKPYGNIYYKKWDLKNPKASILIIHGLGEHINRYEEFASYMASHDIQCIGFDLPGHGRSEGKGGTLNLLMML